MLTTYSRFIRKKFSRSFLGLQTVSLPSFLGMTWMTHLRSKTSITRTPFFQADTCPFHQQTSPHRLSFNSCLSQQTKKPFAKWFPQIVVSGARARCWDNKPQSQLLWRTSKALAIQPPKGGGVWLKGVTPGDAPKKYGWPHSPKIETWQVMKKEETFGMNGTLAIREFGFLHDFCWEISGVIAWGRIPGSCCETLKDGDSLLTTNWTKKCQPGTCREKWLPGWHNFRVSVTFPRLSEAFNYPSLVSMLSHSRNLQGKELKGASPKTSLGGGWATHLKNMRKSKMDHIPK